VLDGNEGTQEQGEWVGNGSDGLDRVKPRAGHEGEKKPEQPAQPSLALRQRRKYMKKNGSPSTKKSPRHCDHSKTLAPGKPHQIPANLRIKERRGNQRGERETGEIRKGTDIKRNISPRDRSVTGQRGIR